MSLNSLLSEYRSLELDAHVSRDDVLSKITQEMGELIEAIEFRNTENIKKEAKDLLVNILSLTSGMWVGLYPKPDDAGRIAIDKIPVSVALLHRIVAACRTRYSRELHPPMDYIHSVFQPLVHTLLELTGEVDFDAVVDSSSAKFKSRIADYLPSINLEDYIDAYSDFPKPGILFRDIAPLLASPEALRYAGFELAKKSRDADVIVGLDARGFIFGTLVAQILEKPFVMIRKKGKLPGATIGTDYSLEYGDNSIEIQEWAIEAGKRVVIIDDLLATGGTFLAAAKLVEKVGGKVEKLVSLISLDEAGLLNHPSREAISAYSCESVLSYQ